MRVVVLSNHPVTGRVPSLVVLLVILGACLAPANAGDLFSTPTPPGKDSVQNFCSSDLSSGDAGSSSAALYSQVRHLIGRAAFNALSPGLRQRLVDQVAQKVDFNGPHKMFCFAPDTPIEVVQAFEEARQKVDKYRLMVDSWPRWGETATDGSGLGQGDPTIITYSFVPNGTPLYGESSTSNLITFLNSNFASEATWKGLFETVFNEWSAVAGISYVYEENDDGVQLPDYEGILGTRGDVRIGGVYMDGGGGVLAYNYNPDWSDMVIDTGDGAFFKTSTSNYINFRNTLAHEHGHGLGADHVCPINETKLMEPYLTTDFDGPQHDDILFAQRYYGDILEDDDTYAQANDLGTLGDETVTFDEISLDGLSDRDWFEFTVPADKRVDFSVTPVGATYLEGAQNTNGSCTTGTSFNSLTLSNLAIAIYNSNGTSLLGSADVNTAGSGESLTNFTLPAAGGTFYLKIYPGAGAVDKVQMYDLSLTVEPVTGAPTPTITNTPTLTSTPVPPTPSPTRTATRTRTFTRTPTVPTSTPTRTHTRTGTATITFTRTSTVTATPTDTGTPTLTKTPIPPTSTPTRTKTGTATATFTSSPTPSGTDTATATNTSVPPTNTPTTTGTATDTATMTEAPPTSTLTATPSHSPTISRTPTITRTPTRGRTDTPTSTPTVTSTETATVTETATATLTGTPTSSPTSSPTASPTFTQTPLPTGTPTSTPTSTPPAQRDLPAYFCLGITETVKISLHLGAPVPELVLIEEQIPNDWIVSEISHDGQFDEGKITWIFIDGLGVYPPPSEVNYEITAQTSEDGVFAGTIAIPEIFTIIGETSPEEECPCYPGDTNCDLRLSIGEAAALLSCWRSGHCGIGDAAQGLTLWLGGECYERMGEDEFQNVPCDGGKINKDLPAWMSKGTTGTATRLLPDCFNQQEEFTVTITLDFPAGVPQVVLLEDESPMGWTVSNISNGGAFSAGKVRWSFVDGLGNYPPPAQVTYTLTPTSDGPVTFEGTLASPDESTVEGTSSLEECPLSIDSWSLY